MPRSPRDKLVRLLAGSAQQPADSASLTLPAEILELAVDGVGQIDLPLKPAQAKKLIGVAEPAHFGHGEDTLLDASVRDTWQLTPSQITLGGTGWPAALMHALRELGDDLGVPSTSTLQPELHSFLIYGKGQFFAPHQDSEKHDDMIATLVVALPSAHTGGELVVDDRGILKRYPASRDDLTFVAFYADRRHEVLPVKTGVRATLTFNLRLEANPAAAAAGPAQAAALLLEEHFTTPTRASSYSSPEIPARLCVLLDHEYSQRGLTQGALKGADVDRAATLIAAAELADCEYAFAQAEIAETWDAGAAYYDDEDDELSQLLDGSTTLTWWTDPKTKGKIDLHVDDIEVCAVTASHQTTPYNAEYTGYMGNYGNTMDRWYHRAALVIWPRGQGFATRAAAHPQWALRTALASARRGDVDQARAETAGLLQEWRNVADKDLSAALKLAKGVEDPALALNLLALFRLETLTARAAAEFAALSSYPASWWDSLRTTWERAAWRDRGERRYWTEARLVELCDALRAADASTVAGWLVSWQWGWATQQVRAALAGANPQHRDRDLAALGAAVAAILDAADDAQRPVIVEQLATFGPATLPLLLAILHRTAPPWPPSLTDLAHVAKRWLDQVLAQPQRSDDDWSIAWSSPGGDADLDQLAGFLNSADDRTLEWRLAAPRRQTIHRCIDDAGLPVTHVTRRVGSPFTLVLTKTRELFEREQRARRDAADALAWLESRI
ncbi:MAG: 2OG-Fe(II) oxygenase [Arachnia sp.]